jgi:hypothetical protein
MEFWPYSLHLIRIVSYSVHGMFTESIWTTGSFIKIGAHKPHCVSVNEITFTRVLWHRITLQSEAHVLRTQKTPSAILLRPRRCVLYGTRFDTQDPL